MNNFDFDMQAMINILFDTQKEIFDNKYEREKHERFKSLCKTKKLVFFGKGYYLKAMKKYLKLKYGVEIHGVYDWVKEEFGGQEQIDKGGLKSNFTNFEDQTFLDFTKYNKYDGLVPEISKEDFYKYAQEYVIFMNADIFPTSIKVLYRRNFFHIYTLRNLAKELISPEIIQKQNKLSNELFKEYDINKLNSPFSTNQITNIATLYTFLEDEKSKKVFLNLLKYKLTEDLHYIMEYKDNVKLQYFDKEVINFSSNEVFVDCGGYTGDSIETFLQITSEKFEHIYTYEPDKENYEILSNFISQTAHKNKITAINAGVYYKNEIFYLKGEGETTTCVPYETDRKTEVVTISDTMKHIPTFIKMDIQTFELQALLGAMDLIKKYKPKLAISIYHKWDDLWNIPLLLKQWVPEYKLKIRHYECTEKETILYASID